MTELQKRVIAVVRSIPKGKVASYGQVALYVGIPRGARQVGWILRGLEGALEHPWWRVINNEGRITIKGNKHHGPLEQRNRLVAEGVVVSDHFVIKIEQYRFKPTVASHPSLFPL